MNWYAVMRVHGFEGAEDDLYVFDTKAQRDSFLKTGARFSYSLVVPWETFPVNASEAERYAKTDGYGDRYACVYGGGARYIWGQQGYEKFWNRRTA